MKLPRILQDGHQPAERCHGGGDFQRVGVDAAGQEQDHRRRRDGGRDQRPFGVAQAGQGREAGGIEGCGQQAADDAHGEDRRRAGHEEAGQPDKPVVEGVVEPRRRHADGQVIVIEGNRRGAASRLRHVEREAHLGLHVGDVGRDLHVDAVAVGLPGAREELAPGDGGRLDGVRGLVRVGHQRCGQDPQGDEEGKQAEDWQEEAHAAAGGRRQREPPRLGGAGALCGACW